MENTWWVGDTAQVFVLTDFQRGKDSKVQNICLSPYANAIDPEPTQHNRTQHAVAEAHFTLGACLKQAFLVS